MKKNPGFVFSELVIAMFIVILISMAVVSYFRSSAQIGLTTLQETPLHQSVRDTLFWLRRDAENSSANSVNNLVFNGGFELQVTANSTPLYWATASNPANKVTYLQYSGANVRNGRGGIQLTADFGAASDTTYASPRTASTKELNVHLKAGGVYQVSAWVKTMTAGAAFGRIRLVEEGASDLVSLTEPLSGSATNWNLISVRYEAPSGSDKYAYVELENRRPGAGSSVVLFDDVAVTAVRGVLATPYSAETSMVMSGDSASTHAGVFFEEWIKPDASDVPQLKIVRYLVNPAKKLIRQEIGSFNSGSKLWVVDDEKEMLTNVSRVSFDFIDADVTQDGFLDVADVTALAGKLGKTEEDSDWDPIYDLNKDGSITSLDQALMTREGPAASKPDPYFTREKSRPVWVTVEARKPTGGDKFLKSRYSAQVYPANP